ncbi:MAG TPA: MBL fold metallo-hydrolase [Candidatus Omnitrophica bacterium]|nr:MBL fold metallo-hydrolase [Candidatus Omnitrophota bacterium]
MGVLGADLTLKRLVLGQMAVNCYIIASKKTKKAFIIDPGDDFLDIKKYLDDNKLEAEFIIQTHGHIDHIAALKEFDLPIYIHELDKDYLTDGARNLSGFMGEPFELKGKEVKILKDNQVLEFGGNILKILHTPGHTPGGISIILDNAAFTGDTLFASGIGRTDFPGSSTDALIKAIKEKLFTLDDGVVIYPGHGEPSTIGREKKENPFFE